jgi:plastocyanin
MEEKQPDEVPQEDEKTPPKGSSTVWLVIVVVIIVIGVFYFYRGKYQATSPTSTPTPAASSPKTNTAQDNALANTGAVTIQNFAFSPASLTVKKGESVTWTNEDSAPHQIVSDNGKFQGPSFSKGQTYSFAFNDAGTFPYHCSIHPMMKATIIVQ